MVRKVSIRPAEGVMCRNWLKEVFCIVVGGDDLLCGGGIKHVVQGMVG